ncbi:SH3 domain-containing protein [Elsinoe australis]|uniref:SH3 domain-containing protein n=1 Tax=Elsinoe australis TaxID=40998 RepID=A0A2P7ZUA9_9PEZI|nr:SH3 domain-containing protein [Elsinoe australis]
MAAQQSTFWEKTKTGGKAGFNTLYSWVDKLGPPVNRLSNKLGSEAFWPTTTDKECDKAARILKSFCKDGFYTEEDRPSTDGPKAKQKVLQKIPAEVIQRAQGLAIFTTMRTGLWIGGSGGSGVLIARKADGSWSSPSGIQVQTLGLGFLVGVDIYDCVLVINTQKALEAFTRVRATLGGDLSVSAGPFGMGGMVETEIHKRQAPIYNYIKSRGFYAGVQIDGTLVIERTDENERFYGQKITAQDILQGKYRHPAGECRALYETLKAAEGAKHDITLLPSEAPPSDFEIVQEGHVFGVPAKDDPDPYGVLQLEKEGMVIKEAGTQKRASWEQFTFSPAITSPVFDTFERNSNRDSRSPAISRRGSWMTNTHSQASTVVTNTGGERRSSKDSIKSPVSMTDMSTQTDDLPPPPPSPGRHSFRNSAINSQRPSMDHIPENDVAPSSPSLHSRSGSWVGRKRSVQSSLSQPSTPPTRTSVSEDEPQTDGAASASEGNDADAEDTTDDLDDEEPIVVEEPVVHTIHTAAAPKVIQKARMVTVPKRGPPPSLPPRNPNRSSGPYVINGDRPSSRASNTSAISPSATDAVSPLQQRDNPYTAGPESVYAYLNGGDRAVTSPVQSPGITPGLTPGLSPGEKRDPWSGILAQHGSVNSSQQSLEVPGAFQSFPTTPAEEIKEPVAKS